MIRSLDINDLKGKIKGDSEFLALLKMQMEDSLVYCEDRWQTAVASQQRTLLRHSTLLDALIYCIYYSFVCNICWTVWQLYGSSLALVYSAPRDNF